MLARWYHISRSLAKYSKGTFVAKKTENTVRACYTWYAVVKIVGFPNYCSTSVFLRMSKIMYLIYCFSIIKARLHPTHGDK